MNTLSWLIYAADVADKIISFSGIGLMVTFVLAGGIIAMSPPICDFDGEMIRALCWNTAKLAVPITLFLATLYVAAPSSRTIYMIAASEAGETIVTSPDAIEMMGDLKAIIKKRLKDEMSAE